MYGYCVNCKSGVALEEKETGYRCKICGAESEASEDYHEGNSM